MNTSRLRVRFVVQLVSSVHVQLAALALIAAGVLAADLYAGPEGASVEHGEVQVDRPNEELTEIDQQSREAIVEYDSFDVGSSETVRFDQPGADARILNRVRSDNPTEIRGALEGNGQVFLTNPSGILFGPKSTVHVGKLYAAAGHLSNEHFLNGTNRFSDLEGTVKNLGTLQGSSVHLVGKQVANIGMIHAEKGVITMSSGQDVLLGTRDGHVFAKIEEAGGSGTEDGSGVRNEGTVDAGDGTVRMSAGDLFATSIFNDGGTVKGSDIELDGTDGTTLVSGVLDASTDIPGTEGGSVRVLGDEIGVFDAEISADGAAGGGHINVGGSKKGNGPLPNAEHTFVSSKVDVSADATRDGDGGQVIVWSDGTTTSHGTISATGGPHGGDGGFVEVSGDALDTSVSLVDVSARTGDSGTVLFDPLNIVIAGGTSDGDDDETGDDPTLFEDGGNQTLNFDDDGSSDFTVYESELESTASSMTLEARRSISASGTFGDKDVLLQQDVDLTLRTRNDEATSDGKGNIDLTTSDDGSNLEFTTQGTGSFSIEAGTANDLSSHVLLPVITTAGGDVNVTANTGSIHVNNSISAGSGTIHLDGRPVNLSADLAADGISGKNVTEVNVLSPGADIQDSIDLAASSGSVNVSSGSFSGAVTIDRALTLSGSGSGSDATSNTVLEGGGSGTGLEVTASDVTVKNLRTTHYGDGLELGSTMSNLQFTNVASVGNNTRGMTIGGGADLTDVTLDRVDFSDNIGDGNDGIRMSRASKVDGLTIKNSHFDHNGDPAGSGAGSGIEVYQHSSTPGELTNVLITNTTFNNNSAKGIYTEKLSNATIENVTISSSGTDSDYAFNSGIDLNLKWESSHTDLGKYKNITIKESTFDNSGVHTTDHTNGLDYASALAIKARGQGSDTSYQSDPGPAVVKDVVVKNNTFSFKSPDVNSTAVRVGEPGAGAHPEDVTLRENRLSDGSNTEVHNVSDPDAIVVDASANWWGTDSPSNTSSLVEGPVDYNPILPSGIDTDDTTPGFQGDRSQLTVHTQGEEISSGRIQSGVDTVIPGGTLDIRPGTYSNPVTIDRDVSIIGPNAGVNPNTESRGTEATVTTPGKNAIEITDHAELTMNGMRFDDVAKFIRTGDTDTNSASGWGSVDLRNNIFNNATSSTQFRFRDDPGATFDFHQNLVSNSANEPGGSFDGFTNGLRIRAINRTSSGEGPVKVDITNNVWTDNAGWAIAPNNITGTIKNNTFQDPTPNGGAGALDNQWGLLLATGNRSKDFSTDLTVTRNTFRNLAGAAMSLDFNFYGKLNATQNIFQNIASNEFTEGAFFVDNDTDVFISGVTVQENRFAKNDSSIVNRSHNDTTLNAPVNWWDSTDDAVIDNDRTTGPVDFTPYLDSGTDQDGSTPGFQADVSVLHVTSRGRQAGGATRIQEGVNRVADPGLLKTHGVFMEEADLLVVGSSAQGTDLNRSMSIPFLSNQQSSSSSVSRESQVSSNQLRMPRIQTEGLMFSGLDRVEFSETAGAIGPVDDGIIDLNTGDGREIDMWDFLQGITNKQ